MANNIMQYESKVWATADSLISVGIKQSDFPKFMMPFFALILHFPYCLFLAVR